MNQLYPISELPPEYLEAVIPQGVGFEKLETEVEVALLFPLQNDAAKECLHSAYLLKRAIQLGANTPQEELNEEKRLELNRQLAGCWTRLELVRPVLMEISGNARMTPRQMEFIQDVLLADQS